jgi:L-asparaginase II
MMDALSAKPNDFVEAALLVRAGMVESRHRAIPAIVSPDGKLFAELGAAKRLIYPRSAVKPLQAVAMQRAGLHLTGAELAISTASHQGTPEHIRLVQSILANAGLTESDLQCPLAWPGNPEARSAATAQSRIAFNCSGKHAGFLAAAVAAGWSTNDYLAATHPLQQLIVEVLEEYSGEQIVNSTIDGCGAPLHTNTVEGLARAIGKFAATDREIFDAMVGNAWVVGDQNSADAVVMRATGFVAKIGAEGVFVIGTPEGYGVAVKVADGSHRATALIALEFMRKHDLVSQSQFDAVFTELAPKVLGGDEIVGEFVLL